MPGELAQGLLPTHQTRQAPTRSLPVGNVTNRPGLYSASMEQQAVALMRVP